MRNQHQAGLVADKPGSGVSHDLDLVAFAKWCSVYRWAARVVLISDSFPLFQGIPGVHGKKGKMGRPVKFSLNILTKMRMFCLDV